MLFGQVYIMGFRVILFYLAFGVVAFLPSSNLFVTVGFVIAERVLYLPSIGFCALVAFVYSTLSRRFLPKGPATLQLLVVGLLVGRCIEVSTINKIQCENFYIFFMKLK